MTLVSASLLRFEAQLSTYKAYDGKSACLRCIRSRRPTLFRVAKAGMLGAVVTSPVACSDRGIEGIAGPGATS